MTQRFRSRPSARHRLRLRTYRRMLWPGWLTLGVVCACVFIGLACLLDMRLRPSVTTASAALAHRVGAQALNEAVTEEISSFPEDDELIETTVNEDHSGMTVTRFNLPLLTKLQAEATTRAQARLEALSRETIRLPMMHLLSGSLLSRTTLTIPVKISLLGTAHSTIETDVETKGVNQVVHVIYLHMTADVMVVTPFVTKPTVIETKAPIAYLVMSGPVPNTYYGGGNAFSSPAPARNKR
ncbi:sporulation protein YunB [Alicyclobacillus suci]|uniref:sporulation protein YunB n=1 Tax=Alicyclobacillus suci TaxID=2816080 RepID=UPI002E281029|nr:sporulation protein YunB [Alicyclobacillus suci]